MKDLKTSTKIIVSILHGLALFFLLWLINNTSYSTSVDEGLLKKIFIVEDLILPNKFKSPYDFIFVNTSKDISLIKDPYDWGNIAITDRNMLRDFFKILADNNNQHSYVLCDLFFEYPSTGDTVLFQQISRCKKILFPIHIKDDSLQKPSINVPSAIADYQTYDGKFSKFKLIYKDTLKTIPLVLYEQLDGKSSKLTYLDLRSFAPRYYLRPYQLLESNKYPYHNLGELLMISLKSKSFYNDYVKNKFIVIGNFETDINLTPIGKMSGPLILVDSYLSLKDGRARLSLGWILFMITSLLITSYILFFVEIKPPKRKVSPWIDFIIRSLLDNILPFLVICSVIVFISELLFSIQLIISPLFFYFIFVSWAISSYNEHFKKQQK